MRKKTCLIPLLLISISVLSSVARLSEIAAADDTISSADRTFFENEIRPVFVEHCYECHSVNSVELGGKLYLDSRDGVLKGGESGPALVAGKPEESLIIQSLRFDDVEMPPEDQLSESIINQFVKWIEKGAPDPRTERPKPTVATTSDGTKKQALTAHPNSKLPNSTAATPDGHAAAELDLSDPALWSFKKRRVLEAPEVRKKDWPRDELDRFVLSEIEANKQDPTEDSPSETLVRRLYYDLIGLPPTLNEVEAFVEDRQQHGLKAVERLVDRLLERPQFGERWGQYWLDVARFGESNGDDGLGRNASFPVAWRYRDYVIDAINRDVPYDRFLTEQIAGDLLPADSAEQRNRQLVATGFLAIGSKPAAAMNKNFAMDIVNDQINVVSTAVMGLSVACARCHDHKHDPISTRDYYALAGIFTSTETLYGLAGAEKLTAPPTDLHELKSNWNQKQPKPIVNLVVPDSYAQKQQNLTPTLRAALNESPEELVVVAKGKSKVEFSREKFATVNSASINGSLPDSSESYSVSFWFKNETANNARAITAYLFSRAKLGDKQLPGDHIGIGGTHDKSRTGKLFVFNGNVEKKSVPGKTVIKRGTWNHLVMVRDGAHVQLFLNGDPNPEIDGQLPLTYGENTDFCLASRSDNFAPLIGNVAHLSIFNRAISGDEVHTLHAASGQSPVLNGDILGLAMGVREKSKPADCKIHVKGDIGKLGPVIPRGFLSAHRLAAEQTDASSQDWSIEKNQSGRLQLAEWLTRDDHPQTARVMVNRVWLHLFGRGLVATPGDFGVYGARPTNLKLLDHLANRFVQDDWSMKRLIRSVVLSRTYQLDSRCNDELAQADPENLLFARQSRRRLDAESLRDSILFVSGQLDSTPGQASDVNDIDILINWPIGESTNLHQKSKQRSIYLCRLRHAPPPELAAFDLPDGVEVVNQRNVTTLPTQALFLFNSPLVIENSELLADAVLLQESTSEMEKVESIYHQVLHRAPSPVETERAFAHVQSVFASLPEGETRLLKSWTSLCQSLMVTNEFRYID